MPRANLIEGGSPLRSLSSPAASMSKGDAIAGGARPPRSARSQVPFRAGWACACVSGVMTLAAVTALIVFMTSTSGGQRQPAVNCTEGLCVVSRTGWGARPPRKTAPLATPVDTVIIHHSYLPPECHDREQCVKAMRSMQDYHMDDHGWDDIGYNFAIGGDGAAYEGRGWTTHGAHSGPRYNYRSIGIVFIGSYVDVLPTAEMLATSRSLIRAGVNWGYVRPDYVLLGHRQVRNTECPGKKLYSLIQVWPHWKAINETAPD